MTICNMTIEGGGRAGMIAPDETTFAWVERARRWHDRPRLARPAHRRRRGVRPRDRRRRRRAQPDGHLGHDPGQVVRVTDAVPEPAARARSARWPTWRCEPGTPMQDIRWTASSSARARTRGIGDLRAAAARRRGPQGRRRRRRDGRPGLGAGASAGRGRGPRRGVPRRRLRLARRGLLDVPGHEPRHRRPGRARAPRPRTATSRAARAAARAPTSSARRWPRRPPSRGTSSTSASGARPWSPSPSSPARVSVLLRDDVDTDQIIPKQFLKRVERTGFGEFLFHDWAQGAGLGPAAPTRSSSPGATSAAARPASTRRGRWRTTASAAIIAPGFADIFRSNCTKIGLLPVAAAPRTRSGRSPRRGEAEVDLGRPGGPRRRADLPLRDRPRHQAPPAQRPRRHRADAPAGRGDRRLRARARARGPVTTALVA